MTLHPATAPAASFITRICQTNDGFAPKRVLAGTVAALMALGVPALADDAEHTIKASARSPLVAVAGSADIPGAVKLVVNAQRLLDLPDQPMMEMREFVLAPQFSGMPAQLATLDLEEINVFGPDTQFVLGAGRGRAGEWVLPLPEVRMYGGTVRGEADSSVFLSIAPGAANGIIRINGRTQVISSGPSGRTDETYIFDPQVIPAGTIHWRDFVCNTVAPEGEVPMLAGGDGLQPCREILIAFDSDYEFTANLFGGNTTSASAYITTLTGALTQIYTGAVNARFRLGTVRLWTTSSDPWNATTTTNQLYQFRDVWNATMTSVPRNLAHFLSGRSLGGGVAWLSVVCNPTYGYGLSANLSGYFPYPIQNNNAQNWDLDVTSHEIGHNFGAIHTHDYCPPVDQCAPSGYWGSCQTATVCISTGTIMSYCHTCSGGEGNKLMQFHAASINSMESFLGGLSCNLSCSNTAPVVAINSPANNSSFPAGQAVSFAGSASDIESGNLTASLVWTSNLQGTLGFGGAFSRSDLVVGTHTITASCTDPGGLTGSSVRTITVIPATNTPPVVTITAPGNGASFTAGAAITFTGTASDAQSGNLSSLIVWTSNLQGQFGVGAAITYSGLVVGTHTITARATDPGNLIGTASITVTITAAPPAVQDRVASSETAIAGTVAGTYLNTQSNNTSYESIRERQSSGNPNNRYSYLEHRWTISLSGAPGTTRTFFVKAYQSASTDGDNFLFDFSTNGGSTWIPMVVVTKIADNGLYQSYSMPGGLSGNVLVRVRDTDRIPGHKTLDTIFVDHMFIRAQ